MQRPKKLKSNDATENANQREAGLAEVLALLEASRAHQGDEMLMGLMRGLGTLLEADTTFITRGLDSPTTRARGIAAWKDGKPKATWEYDLAGNPCQLTYSGKPTFVPCDVERLFAKKRGTGYESYIGVPLLDEAGEVIGHIAVYSSKPRDPQDYSEAFLRLCAFRAEAELRRLLVEDALKDEVTRLKDQASQRDEAILTVAHDLRAPLAAVDFYLYGVALEKLPRPIVNAVESARGGVRELLKMSNEYLELYRHTAADPIAEDTAVDVNALMRVAAKEAALFAASGEVTVRFTPLDEGYSIAGDEKQLRRAMANLLSNACKFAPVGSEVEIWAEIAAHKVTINVFDAGPPIPDDEIALLFDGFLKIAQADGEKIGGLGLPIAKAIVDRHHGEIGVVNLEKGVKCHITLPLRQTSDQEKLAR